MNYIRSLFIQYLFGSNLINWTKLLCQNRFRICFKAIPKVIVITLGNILSFPFYITEKIMFSSKISKVKLKEDPVFVLGHWRSGTTFLVNVLSKDKNLAHFNILHTFAPSIYMCCYPFLKMISKLIMPETRPMDNIKLDSKSPQEEEYAIANLSTQSICHITVFPKNRELYKRYCLFNDLTDKEKNNWKKMFVRLLKKITLQTGGRQLLLKNPVNTARVKVLLELFPNAKFIHIYRNPYEVYSSTKGMYKRLFPLFSLQKQIGDEEAAKFQLEVYEGLYKNYFEQKDLIPEGNLYELSYEEFIQAPLANIEKIYKSLGLKGFDDSKKAFENYIKSQKRYKTNKHVINEETKSKVREYAEFTLLKWGYETETTSDNEGIAG